MYWAAGKHCILLLNLPSPTSKTNAENKRVRLPTRQERTMAPKAAASATTPDSGAGSSSKPAGTWDNIALLNDLLVAFYQVGNQAGNFNTQTNEAVVAFMTAQGHVTSWSAIRYYLPNPSFSPSNCLAALIKAIYLELMKWTPQVHEDILVSVFYNLTLSTEDWAKVMNDLKEMGYTFSESALRTKSALNSLYACTSLHFTASWRRAKNRQNNLLPPIYSCPLFSSGNASTSGNKPTRGWDAAAHEALLLCVIDEVKGGKAFLTEVTRKMQARGYSYSYDAINQHVQKLRKNRDTTALTGPTDSGAGSAKTPTPRKSATPRKRRTPKKEMITDEDDDMNLKLEEAIEDEEMRSPSIRPSKRAKSVASTMDDDMDDLPKLEDDY
ncbi:hypothetical protein N5P37_000651 [Trichoderma harzianum]|nr:hypothetical protein N5P37_000651 [Trichoderma harzianum]